MYIVTVAKDGKEIARHQFALATDAVKRWTLEIHVIRKLMSLPWEEIGDRALQSIVRGISVEHRGFDHEIGDAVIRVYQDTNLRDFSIAGVVASVGTTPKEIPTHGSPILTPKTIRYWKEWKAREARKAENERQRKARRINRR